MTPKQKAQYSDFVTQMAETLATFRHPTLAGSLMPEEWRGLARKETPKKQRITVRMDADVLRFFRKLGPGYQTEINGVLRAFMLARLSELLGPPDGVDVDEVDAIGETMHAYEVSMTHELQRRRKERLGLLGQPEG